jgi:hypothetical protein
MPQAQCRQARTEEFLTVICAENLEAAASALGDHVVSD